MNFKEHIQAGNYLKAGLLIDPIKTTSLLAQAGLTRGKSIAATTYLMDRRVTGLYTLYPYGRDGNVLIEQYGNFWVMAFTVERAGLYGYGTSITLTQLPGDPTECREDPCQCPPCEDEDDTCDDCACCRGTCMDEFECHSCAGDNFCATHNLIHDRINVS